MNALERITCEYVENEDRIRLSGEVASSAPIVIWLTRRMMQRLLPVLIPLLEDKRADPQYAEIMQVFAQQAARSVLRSQVPVKAQLDSEAWVAASVDIALAVQAVTLTFRAVNGQAASLEMEALPLRQWLGILHDIYIKAEWPQEVWPDWIKGGVLPADNSSLVLH